VGRNYRDHVKEMGSELPTEPLIFLKAPSSLLAPAESSACPLARRAWTTRASLRWSSAAVYATSSLKNGARYPRLHGGNDVTARDSRPKMISGPAPRLRYFLPDRPLGERRVDPEAGLTLETRVNGELRQHGSTLDFIFPIPSLLAYITSIMTLEPGDLILTGTPSGIGPLQPGDRVEIAIPAWCPCESC